MLLAPGHSISSSICENIHGTVFNHLTSAWPKETIEWVNVIMKIASCSIFTFFSIQNRITGFFLYKTLLWKLSVSTMIRETYHEFAHWVIRIAQGLIWTKQLWQGVWHDGGSRRARGTWFISKCLRHGFGMRQGYGQIYGIILTTFRWLHSLEFWHQLLIMFLQDREGIKHCPKSTTSSHNVTTLLHSYIWQHVCVKVDFDLDWPLNSVSGTVFLWFPWTPI